MNKLDFDTSISQLSAWADEHELIQKAMDGCNQWLSDGNTEDSLPNGWKPQDFKACFRSHSFAFKCSVPSYPYISTMLDLFINGKEVGYYQLITLLDGKTEDDYFVMYKAGAEVKPTPPRIEDTHKQRQNAFAEMKRIRASFGSRTFSDSTELLREDRER